MPLLLYIGRDIRAQFVAQSNAEIIAKTYK